MYSLPLQGIGNILGVNIANYSFMRDVWGVDLRQGDVVQMWLTVVKDNDTTYPQIIPDIMATNFNAKGNSDYMVALDEYQRNMPYAYFWNVAKIWATPQHSPFNFTKLSSGGISKRTNMVGWDMNQEADEGIHTHTWTSASNPVRHIYWYASVLVY